MGRWPFRCSAVCALGIPEVRTELTSTVLEMLLETEHGSAARLSILIIVVLVLLFGGGGGYWGRSRGYW